MIDDDAADVEPELAGHHEPGAEQAEDRTAGAEGDLVLRRQEKERDPAADGAEQVDGEEPDPAEQLLKGRPDRDQAPTC